ncbi:XK-related protein 8-like [Trachinotus anak]|uniref:XK-related protein 8-like n=1 Tax=Trachinotus anak TaxID=443729 RepID=UPI0039F213E3
MANTMALFKYSGWDFFFTCLGLVFLLLDIVLDILAAVSLYQERAYVSLGILLLFLVGSSVLVQAYSWLWYRYEDFERETKVEKVLSQSQLRLLHWLQLGIYIRHAGVVEISVRSFDRDITEGFAVYLSHDLSMLRLIETFSESCPQLVLMLAIILQRGELDPVTVLKAIGSASAIAFSMTTYHRSLRSFLPDKEKQQILSSMVYFLWNLLLISSRLTALALFASMLPCFIFSHFLCSWLVLFFVVWRCKTDFMESPGGEWLYRATVGLIWYFAWFNVVEGKTRYRTLLYHGYIVADISLLCSLWYWKIQNLHAIITAASVVAIYILGLVLKIIYYKCFHPNLTKEELKGVTPEEPLSSNDTPSEDVVDGIMVLNRCLPSPPQASVKHCNKRMRKLAENFYS